MTKLWNIEAELPSVLPGRRFAVAPAPREQNLGRVPNRIIN